MLSFERSWLLVGTPRGRVRRRQRSPAVSDAVLHYFLGGTADVARDDSPFKNVVVAMLDLADELGLPLNLGGGDHARRRPASASSAASPTRELPFFTHEIVCDPDRLRASSPRGARRAAFFPAYRAP